MFVLDVVLGLFVVVLAAFLYRLYRRMNVIQASLDKVRDVITFAGPMLGRKLEEGSTKVVLRDFDWSEMDEEDFA